MIWLSLLATLALDWFPRGLAPIDTGGAVASAKTCVRCHRLTHDEWAASRHGQSWTNAIFQREYQDKPLSWCVHCHAPLAEQVAAIAEDEAKTGVQGIARPGARPRGNPLERAGKTAEPTAAMALANEGITCVACHVREGRMWAREQSPGSPHDTRTDPSFGSPTFCGGCHQFNFPIVEAATADKPAHVSRYTDLPMQATVHQHAQGPKASEECANCHVKPSGTGHRFPGGHDATFVSRALAVSSCRRGETLEVALANVGAGHNVPTGDLHRHLVLRAWRATAPEKLGEALFGRRFEPVESGGKRTVADTTIAAGTTAHARFRLAALGGAPADPVRLELRLVYTIDEFPFRGRELTEPTWVTMYEGEVAPNALATCKARRSLQ